MRAYIDITSNETFKSKLIPSKIMEASLCLPTKSHNHFAFNFPKSRTIPHCHHQLSHNLSLLFSTRLHGGPRQRLTTPVLRAHITPPEDSSLNKARKHAVRLAATAAMVIACTMGAMCTSSKASAISDYWMKFGPPDPPINTVQTESIKALQGALRCDIGSQKQVQSLRDSLLEILAIGLDEKTRKDFKQVLDIENKNTDLETISLKAALDAWKRMYKNNDKYIIGMVLIDLLINQGDYKTADDLCTYIEGYQMRDGRVSIRRDVLNVLLDPKSAACKLLK